jgi:lipid II:glycine glycyltransferase (peptidoglycan interpeptide bridge formation enzyme)
VDAHASRSEWDDLVLASGGHLLQTWRWGEFKSKFGWSVDRILVRGRSGHAMAQVLFRQKFGLSIGYIPRGPIVPDNDIEAIRNLAKALDKTARRRRALKVIVEPNLELPEAVVNLQPLSVGPEHIQPSRTVKVDLRDDDGLLQQMHQKTRYNVRMAQRRGVIALRMKPTDEAVSVFYGLLQDTSSRNTFSIHDEAYYREFLRTFGDDAVLLFASVEDRPVAGVIAVSCGEEAIYMYGASSTQHRAHGAGFYVQFEAMRWARDRGCKRYDLWGIPDKDPESSAVDGGGRIAGTSSDDWRGLYEFKTRFGGQIIDYPAPLEKRYVPVLAALANRFQQRHPD